MKDCAIKSLCSQGVKLGLVAAAPGERVTHGMCNRHGVQLYGEDFTPRPNNNCPDCPMPTPELHTCRRCQGSGKIHLKDEFQRTLDYVKQHGPVCAEQVYGGLGECVHVTAIHNRLRYLMDYGFLLRERRSRTWFYRAALA